VVCRAIGHWFVGVDHAFIVMGDVVGASFQ